MSEALEIVSAILEADDENTIKDILGAEYLEAPPNPEPEEGAVERHDRWADIKIGNKHFCISYLTPVAVYLPGNGIAVTTRDWSTSTKRHIVKWANEIGLAPGDGYRKYAELAANAVEMEQSELIELFKKWSARVHWSKRQAREAERLPSQMLAPVKSGSDERIDVRPHQEAE